VTFTRDRFNEKQQQEEARHIISGAWILCVSVVRNRLFYDQYVQYIPGSRHVALVFNNPKARMRCQAQLGRTQV
jgi:hypothetical protein